MRIFMMLAVLCSLSGCVETEPHHFGVPQSTWITLSALERQQVIESYNRRLEIKETNRPATQAIGAAERLLDAANKN